MNVEDENAADVMGVLSIDGSHLSPKGWGAGPTHPTTRPSRPEDRAKWKLWRVGT